MGFTPFSVSGTPFRRQRRNERRPSRITKRRTWHEDVPQKESYEQQRQRQQQYHHHLHHHQYGGEHYQQQEEQQREDCKRTSVQIGCASWDQSEIIIGKTCDTEETSKHQVYLQYFLPIRSSVSFIFVIAVAAYYCHGSWEEKDTWYTIVSLKTNEASSNFGQTFCFSMQFGRNAEKTSVTGRTIKTKVSEQGFWLTKLDRVCRRGHIQDERFYTLVSEGIKNTRLSFLTFPFLFLYFLINYITLPYQIFIKLNNGLYDL